MAAVEGRECPLGEITGGQRPVESGRVRSRRTIPFGQVLRTPRVRSRVSSTTNPAAVNSTFLLFFPFLFLTTSYVPRSQLAESGSGRPVPLKGTAYLMIHFTSASIGKL